MNFFESQARARSHTFKLVCLFALAVISLILLTDLLVMLVLGGVSNVPHDGVNLDWPVFAGVSAGVCVVVLAGSLYKTISLSSGGKAIAEELNAQLIPQNTDDLKLRKLLNVVEEMAIASGTPVPPVYLLADEPGINAFAAGFTPRDAIIGITRGAVDHLTRDQLQGVIAHEFSHIFNGDMRLNIRLMGILSGIEIIGMAGYYLLRGMSSSVSSRSRKSGGGQLFILALGLIIIGFAGAFFGGLIKAAVSRQREFLADASAVQFTRNPEGIGGALKRIGGLAFGSVVENPRAAEVSHAFFAQGIAGFMQSLSATHPPLKDRILKIDPHWDGEFDMSDPPSEAQADDGAAQQPGAPHAGIAQAAVMAGAGMAEVANAIEQIGKTKPETVDYARSLIAELPAALNRAAREPFGAIALVYTLLLDRPQEVRFKQFVYLQQHTAPGVCSLMHQLLKEMDGLDIKYRLPIIDLAMPALKQLSPEQYQTFKGNLAALIEMDEKVNMLEWAAQKIVCVHLDAQFVKPAQTGRHLYDAGALSQEIALMLSVLAHAGHEAQSEAEKAFAEAANILGLDGLRLKEKSEIKLADLDRAMAKLENLKPLAQPRVLKACAACVLHDQHISVVELELLRAFADVLGCPMPLIAP